MGCRGCGARRANIAVSGNTFGQRPPQTQIGNASKTFGHHMTVQGGRQYGKTIQTSAVNPNNMGQAPCCVGGGEPPPCPEPVFCCPVPGLLASQADQQQSFTRESFPNLDGLSVFTTGSGSVEAKTGRAVLTGAGSATLLSQFPAEVSALKTWCLCVVFDLMNYPSGAPAPLAEIGIGSAPGVVAPKIVWRLTQALGMELVVVNAVNVLTGSCASPLAPGQHTIRMCYDEDTDTLTTKLDGAVICTESNFVASHAPLDVLMPVRFFEQNDATIKVRSYCLSRLKDFCEGMPAIDLTVLPPPDSAVIGVDVNNLGPQHPAIAFSRPVQVISFTLTQLTGAGAGPIAATPNLGNVPGYEPVTLPIITSEINLDTTGVTTLGETYRLTAAWNDPCTGYQEFSWEFQGVSA